MSKAERDLLQEVKSIVSQCDRCGTCRMVCPLSEVNSVEASAARGKNNIARGLAMGGLEPTPEVLAAVNFCLLCRACIDSCPSKIKTDEAMIAVRQHFADHFGGAGAKYKLMGGMLKSRRLVKLAAGTFGVLRTTGIHKLVPGGVVPGGYKREQYLRAFAGPAALPGSAQASDIAVSEATKVAYFHGCGIKMMFPEAAAETLTILGTVCQPKTCDNVCCGLPHLAHGLREDFLELAKENIRLFEDADVVVCDCASCSGTLKHIAGYFKDDPEWADRAAAFSQKIMDLTEYLVKVGYQPRQRVNARLTYHEPCHLGRGQGIKKQPRELLKAAGEFVEMKGADTCCGGAGSFHMDYPEVSAKILAKKRENIEKTGAQIVVTECPVCLAQLTKAAEQSGGKFQAMHISQVI